MSTTTTRLHLRVSPRAPRSRVVGRHGDAWKVQVAAQPVDGRANDALRALLAEALGVERGALAIVAGRGGRDKVVEVAGLSAPEVEVRLGLAAGNVR